MREMGEGGLVSSARATLKRLQADPFDAQPAEQHRYKFENPNPDYASKPRTFTADARDEASARRSCEREVTGSGSWPLLTIDGQPPKEG